VRLRHGLFRRRPAPGHLKIADEAPGLGHSQHFGEDGLPVEHGDDALGDDDVEAAVSKRERVRVGNREVSAVLQPLLARPPPAGADHPLRRVYADHLA